MSTLNVGRKDSKISVLTMLGPKWGMGVKQSAKMCDPSYLVLMCGATYGERPESGMLNG